MRWRTGTRSGNVEDIRGMSGGRAGGLGIVGIIVVIGLALVLGIDPISLLGSTDLSSAMPAQQSSLSREEQDLLADNATLVLGDTEKTWAVIFEDELGKTYQNPKLVLFTGSVDSACGYASAAIGPFYCPGDEKVYLDLDFFDELNRQYGAPGDFAQAYVITHEVGHHVQNLLGTSDYVDRKSRQLSGSEANKLSVALELQADCYAGVWANRAQRQDLILEKGDLEEALNAANAIGDDTLQKEAQGYVVPDSFTHGTSAERVRWFRKGMDSGQVSACENSLLPAVT
ncbi:MULTISPECIES: neutral zinc metallopeptidase [unclassified Methanoregula]|uniref:KPN_02809 family neutral zinc metallopeptidase n=1 Tax=unclassified Methanoregula TaxID=2649730 RepID=UPI0009C8DE64|nr:MULTISPECIES: neutral zinc metallopeptidase [unclassified Methanoregula]OPX65274.1 MAG: putative neutral zinc metallopeptidase [Methanoregula sp. PtaB.Bin085]OPY32183.1 MAG: putative neutral zinc metallopeptidase [Methanoregula sp. PtaU1.Bin006]